MDFIMTVTFVVSHVRVDEYMGSAPISQFRMRCTGRADAVAPGVMQMELHLLSAGPPLLTIAPQYFLRELGNPRSRLEVIATDNRNQMQPTTVTTQTLWQLRNYSEILVILTSPPAGPEETPTAEDIM